MTLSCDCCGLCCQHLIVETVAADVLREPRIDAERPIGRRAPGLSILDACWILAGPGMPCPFLTPENRCGIYATRPHTCVAFIAGSPKCRELRQQFSVPPLVPQSVANPVLAEIIEAAIAEEPEDSGPA
jgi:Fe-S-cluster containining protein